MSISVTVERKPDGVYWDDLRLAPRDGMAICDAGILACSAALGWLTERLVYVPMAGGLESGDDFTQRGDFSVEGCASCARGAEPGAWPAAVDHLVDGYIAGVMQPGEVAREVAVGQLERVAQVGKVRSPALTEHREDP